MPTTILLMPSVKCTKCQSTNLVKAGFTHLGHQRYKCKDCGANGTFSGNVGFAKKTQNKPCYICGETPYAKGLCRKCYNKLRYQQKKNVDN